MRERPGLEAAAPRIDALAGLDHSVRLSEQALCDLLGERPPAQEPAARRALAEWLDEARMRKTVHQPTYAIFHRELNESGEIGRVIGAVLEGRKDAAVQARAFLQSLDGDRSAQERFVTEAERRSNRPRRDRIEGMALDWFCRHLQEACDHLRQWLEAQARDASREQNRLDGRLRSAVGGVRKALEKLGASLAEGTGDEPLAAAATTILKRAVDDAHALVTGGAPQPEARRLATVLQLPLLRLPGGCQDLTFDSEAGDDFAEEARARDRRLLEALSDPASVAPDLPTAFEARLAEQAILTAERILETMVQGGLPAQEQQIARQRLEEAREAARRQALERVARLRQSLNTISYLDQHTAASLPEALARLSTISSALSAPVSDEDSVTIPAHNRRRDPGVPPDFPELDEVLSAMERERDALRQRIADNQRSELEALAQSAQSEAVVASARALLEGFERRDPVTIDDALADLRAGRPYSAGGEEAPDPFDAFHPGFVKTLEDNPDTTRRGSLLKAARERGQAGALDFTDLPETRLRRLSHLVETWGGLDKALRQAASERLHKALSSLFENLGFSGVKVAHRRDVTPNRIALFELRSDVPRSTGWFLPPAFGSDAGGHYPLLVISDKVTTDELMRQIAAENPDAAWMVVCTGRLGLRDRENLAIQSRRQGRKLLLLDEVLLLFAAIHTDDPLEGLFRAGLPFGFVQPFSITAGRIPPEVFVGRREEIDRIVARQDGASLIYGGRQLGKSALLNHVRHERHRPEQGQLALYLDIKSLGGPAVKTDTIWPELAHQLRAFPGLETIPDEPNGCVRAIEEWLEEDRARSCLAMFDEADNFLRAEHEASYPNLLKLKGLMESTGRRFKAVFAGLHNVRRMAKAPNSPLPHLGERICIGPMNLSPENRSALRRLATEPFRTAGLDYARPDLAADLLARMNYYPSLVQVFGREIVENYSRRASALRTAHRGPRWKLGREQLFEGEAAERISGQIRDRFQLTLNLDVRYDCIARSIALHRFTSPRGETEALARGLTAQEILQITHWPERFPSPTLEDFRDLLDEMVDLGVLARSDENRFGLRNAQVAQMLGGKEDLEAALVELLDREPEPDYDATLYHRSLRPELPAARAPLSDRDLDRLFDSEKPGLRVVVCAPEIVGGQGVERLRAAARLWLPSHVAVPVGADPRAIGSAIEELRGGQGVVFISGPWSARTAEQLAARPAVKEARVLPVWVLDRLPDEDLEVPPVVAGPWSQLMLRHWLLEEGLAPSLDDAETRKAILAVSGGAPARLEALRPRLETLAAQPPEARRLALEDWARETPLSGTAIGLSEADRAILSELREFGPQEGLSLADLRELQPHASEARLRRLALLGCLRPGHGPGSAPVLTPLGELLAA
ncbi:MAG: hypothetical protein D6811_09290 [Alphaproteobacteria bacterium]|nr:MAG: hypothetical protein D6811_09290 [Alphaproteobacteria bacterium]